MMPLQQSPCTVHDCDKLLPDYGMQDVHSHTVDGSRVDCLQLCSYKMRAVQLCRGDVVT